MTTKKSLNNFFNICEKNEIINNDNNISNNILDNISFKKKGECFRSNSKVLLKFLCETCGTGSNNKKDYNRHCITVKHLSRLDGSVNITKDFVCICGKEYINRQSLYMHKKKCIEKSNIILINGETPEMTQKMITIIQDNSEFKNMLMNIVNQNSELRKQSSEATKENSELIKQNIDLQKQVLEVCKNIQPGINNSMNNSNNKTFNLNLFLNEQCKDAMNMSDFVNSFHLKMEDLESVGELGYVEGISKLLVNKLNDLDVYKRPMHCSDAKRETLYVKDQDKWEKEQNDNPKIRKAIKKISHRNTVLLSEWRDTHPGSRVSTSEVNTQYMSLVRQSNGGNEDITDSENKIIRRLAKEVVIAK